MCIVNKSCGAAGETISDRRGVANANVSGQEGAWPSSRMQKGRHEEDYESVALVGGERG